MKQTKKPEKLLGNELEGLIIAHFGATAEVEDTSGQIYRCHLRKNSEPVITGDRVLWRLENNGTGIVVTHQPRKSLLSRPEGPKKVKLIAANIDDIIIVSAPPPIFSEYLIDRYLVAAENLQITPVILLNKIDLLDDTTRQDILRRLAPYEKIGYRVILSSTKTPDGLNQLETFLKNKTCVLVGTSGVGKSSIIARFAPDQSILVGDTSTAGLGKHTTTSTRFYHLPQGGNLIDSPGVREFSLWNMPKDEILKGFPDFIPFLNQCKFRDCQHQKEPGCALQKAVSENEINAARFASYLEMIKG
jgi:ribosome biogenesis GTPase